MEMRRSLLRLGCFSALFAIATLLSGCTLGAYDVNVDYECANFNKEYKTCMKWKQKGQLSPSTQCLPGHALLQSRSGVKRLDEIQIGDEVLGLNHATGVAEYSEVRAWLHRHAKGNVEMLDIKTDAGTLTASPYHSVAVLNGTSVDYAFMRDIQPGHRIVALNGSVAVLGVDHARSHGFYAPLTKSSNFYVSVGDSDMQLLVHSFAHMRNPRKYEVALHSLLDVVQFFAPSIHTVSNPAVAYAHPVVRVLTWIIGLPLDPAAGVSWQDGNDGEAKNSAGDVCSEDGTNKCAPELDTPTNLLQVDTSVNYRRGAESKLAAHTDDRHGQAPTYIGDDATYDSEFTKIIQITLGTPPFVFK